MISYFFCSDFTGVPEILTVTCGSHKRPSEEKKEDDLFVRSDKDRQNAIDQPPQVRSRFVYRLISCSLKSCLDILDLTLCWIT